MGYILLGHMHKTFAGKSPHFILFRHLIMAAIENNSLLLAEYFFLNQKQQWVTGDLCHKTFKYDFCTKIIQSEHWIYWIQGSDWPFFKYKYKPCAQTLSDGNRLNKWKTLLNHDRMKSINFLNSDEIVSDGNFLKLQY